MKTPLALLLTVSLASAAVPCATLQDADMLVVLGAALVSNSSGAIVPGPSADCRSSGAAMLHKYLGGTNPVVTSGGYLIGVRYEVVNNTILNPPNTSVAAFAHARTLVSEATAMRQNMVQGVGPGVQVDPAMVLVEEDSASTIDNAVAAGGMIGTRLAILVFNKSTACEALVTSLYHMPRAVADFNQYAWNNSVVPAYAEDWVALIPPTKTKDWIPITVDFYSREVDGYKFNSTLIGEIMRARRAGDLSRSVAEALPPSTAFDPRLNALDLIQPPNWP
jgi:hypothetical protein